MNFLPKGTAHGDPIGFLERRENFGILRPGYRGNSRQSATYSAGDD